MIDTTEQNNMATASWVGVRLEIEASNKLTDASDYYLIIHTLESKIIIWNIKGNVTTQIYWILILVIIA